MFSDKTAQFRTRCGDLIIMSKCTMFVTGFSSTPFWLRVKAALSGNCMGKTQALIPVCPVL